MQEFLENFGDLKEAAQVAKLHNILKPYLLRRIKEDVEKSLPPKEETIVEVNRRESLFAVAEYLLLKCSIYLIGRVDFHSEEVLPCHIREEYLLPV